jgi:hypothetical protein
VGHGAGGGVAFSSSVPSFSLSRALLEAAGGEVGQAEAAAVVVAGTARRVTHPGWGTAACGEQRQSTGMARRVVGGAEEGVGGTGYTDESADLSSSASTATSPRLRWAADIVEVVGEGAAHVVGRARRAALRTLETACVSLSLPRSLSLCVWRRRESGPRGRRRAWLGC